MVLCTINKSYEKIATDRLESQQICYVKQDAGERSVNIYFGALLGYDICMQCERFCTKKKQALSSDLAGMVG